MYLYGSLLMLAWIIAPGCSPNAFNQLQSEPPRAEFGDYYSYDYGESYIVSSESPVLKSAQFSDRVRNEFNFQLPGHGLRQNSDTPDLLLYYYAIATDEPNNPIREYRIGFLAERYMQQERRLDEYPRNTFVLDVVDRNRNELIWRGSIAMNFDDPDEMYKNLSRKINALLERYPGNKIQGS